VNQAMDKLTKNMEAMTIGHIVNPPNITPVEPFEHDQSGAVFKSYPRHAELSSGAPPEERVSASDGQEDLDLHHFHATLAAKAAQAKIDFAEEGGAEEEEDEEEDEDEDADEDYGEEEGVPKANTSLVTAEEVEIDEEAAEGGGGEEEEEATEADSPLTSIQRKYGIPSTEDLTVWQGFRSDFVQDLIYADEDTGILKLYEAAEQVTLVYEREALTMDEFLPKLNRMLGAV